WQYSPRASRKYADTWWARFGAAQDVFFQARDAANAELDQQYAANLAVKEQILKDAQQHLPFKDLDTARKVMQDLRRRWDEAGRVPRKDISRMENELSKLERDLSDLEQERWRKTDPETKARTDSAVVQLEE